MRITFFLLLLPAFLSAQSRYLNDPDIVWAKSFESDWVLESPSNLEDTYIGATTLKLLRTPANEKIWQMPVLAALVFDAAKNGKLPVYTDPHCTIRANAVQALTYIDSIYTFDPETYEEINKIEQKVVDPYSEVTHWRVRQVLAYHRKKAAWTTHVEAVAPICIRNIWQRDSITGKDTMLVVRKPVFWFKADNQSQKLKKSSIVWAKNIFSREGNTYVPLHEGGNLVKVAAGFHNPVTDLVEVLRSDFKTPFYDYLNDQSLTKTERMQILGKTDTIITYDPETYAETVKVVTNYANPDDIRQLRLVQNWYWDEKNGRLSIHLEAVGVMQDSYDDWGNFRFSRVLFYSRSKK